MSLKEFSLDDVIQARRDRRSWKSIGDEYGVHKYTVARWAKRQPEFPSELLESYRHARTQLETEDLQRMVDDHMNDAQIALEIGSNEEAVQALRRRRGIYRVDPGSRSKPATPEQIAEAGAYLDDGYSYAAAADMAGINEKAVARHFPGRGFTRKQTSEAAVMGQRLSKIAA